MSQAIDKKLFAAIDQLNDQQKKEVLVFVGHFLDESDQKYDKWEDDNFVAEIDRRYDYYKNGGKMISAEESKMRIKAILEK